MDIVIPYKQSRHNEIDFCIKGIQKHLKNVGNIYIVTEPTISHKLCKRIICKDKHQSRFKEQNIFRKVVSACKNKEVSDDFLFMNDDHFLTQDFDINNFPYYYKGDLTEALIKNQNGYKKTMRNTLTLLTNKGKPTSNFDIHCPMIINKDKFLCTFVNIDWDKDFGYGLKSLYCNLNDIEGYYIKDLKLNNVSREEMQHAIKERPFFSTGTLNDEMIKLLNEIYD